MENCEVVEKADEEKSEKEENMEVTCSVSVDGQEKQEFSFTLYDFDTKEKASKQDVEKIVVRTICEALGKTLRLPPSGSRTIKVKLAISPDCNQELGANELHTADVVEPSMHQDYDSSKSANTASTYLMPSSLDKSQSPRTHFFANPVNNVGTAMQSRLQSAMPSPKLKLARHNRLISLQKQELKWSTKDHYRKAVDGNNCDNGIPVSDKAKAAQEPIRCQNPQHLSNRVHVPESRERRNHYLDLAGIENDAPHRNDSLQKLCTLSSANPNYSCPYMILDHSHICHKPHHLKDISGSLHKKSPIHAKGPICETSIPNGYKTKLDPTNQDDLLNLNLDICDIVPDAKFDWDRIYHRRSKSYDLHESGFIASASLGTLKSKVKQNHNGQFSPNFIQNPSVTHHVRFRHRDKERQRAMQQVADWLAQEHVKEDEQERTYFTSKKIAVPLQENTKCIEKHEYHHHHHHEHIHHHYHHFVEF